MGFIHSKNLRATARLIVLSVMEVNFRMSRCNIFFSCVMFIVYIYLYLYIQLFSVLFFEIKKRSLISLFFRGTMHKMGCRH